MKKFNIFAALIACTLLVTSCGSASSEDKLVAILAETICVADNAYKSIEDLRANTSTTKEAQDQMKEASNKLSAMMRDSFSTEDELIEARAAIQDKEAFNEKAIAMAKAKCSPTEKTIEEVTSDMNS